MMITGSSITHHSWANAGREGISTHQCDCLACLEAQVHTDLALEWGIPKLASCPGSRETSHRSPANPPWGGLGRHRHSEEDSPLPEACRQWKSTTTARPAFWATPFASPGPDYRLHHHHGPENSSRDCWHTQDGKSEYVLSSMIGWIFFLLLLWQQH